MKKFAFIFVILLGLSVSASAQYYYDRSKNPDKVPAQKTSRDFDTYYSFSWDNNAPLSNQNFISQTSNLGTKFSLRKRLNNVDHLWVGGDLAWAVYQQHWPYGTYQYGTTTLATELYNYSYNYSLTLNIDYLFTPTDKMVVPFAGLGVGLAYDKFVQYYNVYGPDPINSYGLQVRPEAGVIIGFKENSSWRLKAAFHFDYASNNGKLVANNFITPGNDDYHGFVNMGLSIGIVKMAW
jgi:hypothetical protein